MAPKGVRQMRLYDFRGQTAAIDITSYLYRGLYNSDLNDGGHLMFIFNQVAHLRNNGITPIYVFDGSPPEQKKTVIDRRIDIKARNEKKAKSLMETGKVVEAGRVQKTVIRVRESHIKEVKRLLKYMGVCYIHADTEAEIVCARLYRQGLVNFCIGVDLDLLPFGAGVVMTRLKNSDTRVTVYILKKIHKGFGFSHRQFIDYCILCGCDYTNTVKGVGPKTAYTLLSKYGSISEIPVCKGYKYKSARRIFLDKNCEKIKLPGQRSLRASKVRKIMSKTSIKPELMEKRIKKM